MQRTVDYRNGTLFLIDQTLIPSEFKVIELNTVDEVADAIISMKVRGAPAIGIAAAIGIAIAARNASTNDTEELLEEVESAAKILKNTRPTAVNLFWGIDRMLNSAKNAFRAGESADNIRFILDDLALLMIREDEETNRLIGTHGAKLLPDEGSVLTHCNAGALACVSYGTALGVVRAAIERGKKIQVYADETRPRLQGMKLTCFELSRDNIPVTVIADNMAGSLMRKGAINCVIVGADRIAANGDVANKIGTYSLAVLAHYHNVPFYVAAPLSTIDFSLECGDVIPIEERTHDEMTHINGQRICPEGVDVINPSFDVTPSELVSAIITEKGICYPPYNQSLMQKANVHNQELQNDK